MFVACIICTESLSTEQDVVVTSCGHCFHNSCIRNWFNTSRTCATCRQPSSASSLLRVYFEQNDTKINDLHNDLLAANSKLTKELGDLKKNQRLQSEELRETSSKLKSNNEELKTLQRAKQCDDMALAGYRAIKSESEKEIVRLKEQVQALSLDLLAEKQLRRIHQTTLSKLEPENPDYDVAAMLNDESLAQRPSDKNKHYSITPFWQLNCEAATGTVPKEIPKEKSKQYVIPSKIQKADEKLSTLSSKFKFRQLYKSPVIPSVSLMADPSRPRSSSPGTAMTPQYQFGVSQPPVSQNSLVFKFGDSSPGFRGNVFQGESSSSKNGFQLLSSSQASSAANQNLPTSSNSDRYREQIVSPADTDPTTSPRFLFKQKISDR